MVMLSNTLSGKKERLSPIQSQKISLYACGITPYDRAHIGHGRSYVSFDLLYRWLTFLGYDVTYVRNYTDIDDKLLHKAEEQFGDPHRYPEIADAFIVQYQGEMDALNCVPPQHEPRVTKHIPVVIQFIQDLIDKGHAYESGGNVYFAVDTFPSYGKLSRQQTEELIAGTRGEVDPHKRNPLDFALWKSEKEGTFWKSPWGWGRPGWHIECSALASHYLGDEIDIHGGGRDLIFPHHENEIAQSEARSGKPFARLWVHNGLVNINKEKMSKSLGNILALEDLLQVYDPMELRFYFLLHHYRSPLEFSIDELERAIKSYRKICRILGPVSTGTFSREELMEMPITEKMLSFLEDDLNTPGAFAVLFDHLDTLKKDQKQAAAVKQLLQTVMGITCIEMPEKKIEITPEIQKLIDEREQARAEKNWARADEIRDQLVKMGVEVQDKKQ